MPAMRHPWIATVLVAVVMFGLMTAVFRGDLTAFVIFAALALGGWRGLSAS
jgi:hypothetical protein